MEMNARNFLFFFTINPALAFITHVIRIILETREKSKEEAENQNSGSPS